MPEVVIDIHGPMFRGHPEAVVQRAVQGSIQELIELGEQRLDQMLRPRPAGVYLSFADGGRSTGHYRLNVHGEVKDGIGRITDGGVTYGPWLEGLSSRNQTSRFKGYSSFRRTQEWLQTQVPKVAEAWIGKAVRELNGG